MSDIKRSNALKIKKFLKKKYNIDAEVTLERGTIKGVDLFTNIALRVSKQIGQAPIMIASEISELNFTDMEATYLPPGFVNFTIKDKELIKLFNEFDLKKKKSRKGTINIEFVSANPTGPLNVVSGRAAAFGVALSNIMEYCGYKIIKEYYINDAGNQINNLINSVLKAYCKKHENEKAAFSEDEYKGKYVCDLADKFKDKIKSSNDKKKTIRDAVVPEMIKNIKKTLSDMGLKYDIWFHEKDLYNNENVLNEILDKLRSRNLIYEKDNALWIRNTALGDTQDWVLRKSNGEYTYLMGDIIYHIDKYKRGYDNAINIWGPDHISGVNRLQCALRAFDINEFLSVIILQQINLIKDGKRLTMSKREGNYHTLDEVMKEVGNDVSKYYFLSRGSNQHIDFCLDKFQKEKERSPVFYIQYMFARINGILRKIGKEYRGGDIIDIIAEQGDILRSVYFLDDIINEAVERKEPAYLLNHLSKIAAEFHKFYHNKRILGSSREQDLLNFTIKLGDIIKKGLNLLGIDSPERM